MISDAGDTTIVTAHMKSSSGIVPPRWSLLTNHGHVLVCVAGNPDARLRDIAQSVGITERTAAQIVNDLEQAGYLTKTRDGRRNRYEIDGERRVRTPRLATMTIAQLLGLLLQALDQPFV
jgi:DNA-binding MarR family transcriptional regulator